MTWLNVLKIWNQWQYNLPLLCLGWKSNVASELEIEKTILYLFFFFTLPLM